MNRVPPSDVSEKCSSCIFGSSCIPPGFTNDETDRLDAIVSDRIRLKKNETLYLQGDSLNALYGIRFGSFKTQIVFPDGRSQVTGFHLPGELLGLGGISGLRHQSNASALEDSEVCVLHLPELEKLARQLPSFQQQLHRIMSAEISQYRRHLLSLGSMRAEERLATFLLDLSKRFAARGFSPSEFNLRMSREELGSYLGMQIETVSRLFSRFTESGLLQIKLRNVKLIDIASLSEIAGIAESSDCPKHH